MLEECLDCGTRYAPDAPRCPHCGGAEHRAYSSDNPPLDAGGDATSQLGEG